jgi:acetate kinase
VNVLTVNGGSSTIKCAIFRQSAGSAPERVMRTVVENGEAASLLDSLERHPEFAAVGAVGHRVVHGMQHVEPELISETLLTNLRAICPFVPEHLPAEIALIEAIRGRHPAWPQVACFDTAFHHGMPRVAKLIAVPRRFLAKGVERYGFHGLSYEFLMGELAHTDSAGGRVILAHLGAGASLAAVRDGKSIDTSMGFTPASGLVMGTRAGDIDPGLAAFLAREESMTPAGFERMASHESGLVGISETSADMRELLEREATDVRAAEAVALFCYQARKWIGAFTAALDGLDTLVFAGGIGENSPVVRARICEGLRFLGVDLDAAANAGNAGVISARGSRVSVRVIRTDEELMIARCVYRMLGNAA